MERFENLDTQRMNHFTAAYFQAFETEVRLAMGLTLLIVLQIIPLRLEFLIAFSYACMKLNLVFTCQ